MATKVQKGPSSWAYTIKRKAILPRPIHLTFNDEAKGDAYVAHLEKLIDAGMVPDEFSQARAPTVTVGHAIHAYLDAVHVSHDDAKLLGVLDKRIGGTRLEAVNYSWAEEWVAGLRIDMSPATVRHYVGALARCFDWLVRHGKSMLVANPLRQLPKRYAVAMGKADVERDRRLHAGEEPNILAIMAGQKPEGRERPLELRHGDSLLLLFNLALETAMRMREMFTLSPDQVDLAKKTIFLDKTKNGDKRQVPLSSVALALLAPYAGADGLIFPWWDGDTSKASLHKTTALLSAQFARIFNAAGCPDLRFHDLRHEATSRLFERTKLSDIQIAKITGHKSTRVLMRYANLRGSDLAEQLW